MFRVCNIDSNSDNILITCMLITDYWIGCEFNKQTSISSIPVVWDLSVHCSGKYYAI